MRKILIAIFLITVPFSAKSDNCTPNNIRFDVCAYAASIENETKQYLPYKITNNMFLTEIKSDGKRVISIASMAYSREDLYNTLNNNKIMIEKNKEKLREITKDNTCRTNSPTKHFISLGGEVEYDYTFNDGDIYDVVTIKQCN